MERAVNEKPLLAMVGPTASGKTALSLHLAQRFSGEIVSCDSVAVYREFEIGTAKPSLQDRARVPHHLIDVAAPNENFTAGEYSRRGREAIAKISERGLLPIVVGGTGLYLRALIEGLFQGPPRSEEIRERLRTRATQCGPGYLHKILARLDSTAAEKIHPNDDSKIVRAIEVSLLARRPMTELWKHGRDPLQGYRILRIGLDPDRTALYDRINRRAELMFESGLVDETRDLLGRYGENIAPLASLGYKQALQFLRNEVTLDESIRSTQQGHRNYAKRQMTWFRREPNVNWMSGFGDSREIQAKADAVVSDWLDSQKIPRS